MVPFLQLCDHREESFGKGQGLQEGLERPLGSKFRCWENKFIPLENAKLGLLVAIFHYMRRLSAIERTKPLCRKAGTRGSRKWASHVFWIFVLRLRCQGSVLHSSPPSSVAIQFCTRELGTNQFLNQLSSGGFQAIPRKPRGHSWDTQSTEFNSV